MRGRFIVIAASAGLAACNQSGTDNAVTNASAKAAAPAKKHPSYCFFKDAATKGWAASVDASGNVIIKGKVHIDDRRYMSDLSDSEVTGDKASVWLTMTQNSTGMGAPDNTWDVSVTIPGSSAVKSLTVLCGKKTVAELAVRR